jgi:hypothetical protein
MPELFQASLWISGFFEIFHAGENPASNKWSRRETSWRLESSGLAGSGQFRIEVGGPLNLA